MTAKNEDAKLPSLLVMPAVNGKVVKPHLAVQSAVSASRERDDQPPVALSERCLYGWPHGDK